MECRRCCRTCPAELASSHQLWTQLRSNGLVVMKDGEPATCPRCRLLRQPLRICMPLPSMGRLRAAISTPRAPPLLLPQAWPQGCGPSLPRRAPTPPRPLQLTVWMLSSMHPECTQRSLHMGHAGRQSPPGMTKTPVRHPVVGIWPGRPTPWGHLAVGSSSSRAWDPTPWEHLAVGSSSKAGCLPPWEHL